ncbi:MAG: guanylate kinase [Clostridioides sp.]|jgi:guanylate kinase|nr:guanylate kinase [Clostridioides sp.]
MLKRKGLLLVVSGPSGAGKGTICKALLNSNENLKLSVSVTTRKSREGEVEGVNYYFIDNEKFNQLVEADELLEYAHVYGNFYGTPKEKVIENLEKGNDVILEIEMKGAMQVRERYPEGVFIFTLPPSLEELKNRIVGRGTETPEEIHKRLSSAYDEIKLIDNYDYFVINEEVATAVETIENIIKCEKNKVERYRDVILEKFEEEL